MIDFKKYWQKPKFQSGDRVRLPNGQTGILTSKDKTTWFVQLDDSKRRIPCNEFDLDFAP